MTEKKLFLKNELWGMDADTFSTLLYSKNVKVYFEDDYVELGFVSEIGLAANLNINTEERLPVSIKVGSHHVCITKIKQIELL